MGHTESPNLPNPRRRSTVDDRFLFRAVDLLRRNRPLDAVRAAFRHLRRGNALTDGEMGVVLDALAGALNALGHGFTAKSVRAAALLLDTEAVYDGLPSRRFERLADERRGAAVLVGLGTAVRSDARSGSSAAGHGRPFRNRHAPNPIKIQRKIDGRSMMVDRNLAERVRRHADLCARAGAEGRAIIEALVPVLRRFIPDIEGTVGFRCEGGVERLCLISESRVGCYDWGREHRRRHQLDKILNEFFGTRHFECPYLIPLTDEEAAAILRELAVTFGPPVGGSAEEPPDSGRKGE